MKLLAALTLVSMLCLGAFAADNGTPEQTIDLAKFETDAIERADRWLEQSKSLLERIPASASDPSYLGQKAYFESLKTDFITVLETPPEQLSDNQYVQALHSSLRHYAGISKKLTFYPSAMGIGSPPTVFTWGLESSNLQLRRSAAEQLCKWLVQNPNPTIQGWATINGIEDASQYQVSQLKQVVQRFWGETYVPYFTEEALADFMQFINSIEWGAEPPAILYISHKDFNQLLGKTAELDAEQADAFAFRRSVNQTFRDFIKYRPDELRAYLLKKPGISPEATQALFDKPWLANAFNLTGKQGQ